MVENNLSRRELLALAGAAAPAVALGRWPARAWRQGAAPNSEPLPTEWFVRQSTNAEMRWEAMRDQSLPVPTEPFFVCDHTAPPRIDAAPWRRTPCA